MNIDDYRYILTIAEEGSITKAAQKLYITQPALSQRLKVINSNYGVELFTSGSSGIYLTQEGRCFVKYAREILSCEASLRQELADLQGLKTGTLRIGTSQLSNSVFFQAVVAEFHKAFPEIRLDFVEQPSRQLLAQLGSGQIDVGILHNGADLLKKTTGHPEPVLYEDLFQDRLILIPRAGSELERRAQELCRESGAPPAISPGELADEPLALPDLGTRSCTLFMAICRAGGVTPQINHWSRNYATLSSLAVMGLASAVMLESFLSSSSSRSMYYFDTAEPDSIPMVIAWPNNQYLSRIAREFITLSKQHGTQEGPRRPA